MSSETIITIIGGAALTGFVGYLWDKLKRSESDRKKTLEELVKNVNALDQRVDKCEWEISSIKENQHRHDVTTDKIFGLLGDIQSTLGEIKERLAKVEA